MGHVITCAETRDVNKSNLGKKCSKNWNFSCYQVFFLLYIYLYCCKVLKSAISAKLQKIIKMTDLAPLTICKLIIIHSKQNNMRKVAFL